MIQTITVSLTSSTTVDKKYFDLATIVGKEIAKKGMNLVYGGTSYGMMYNLANSYKEEGGKKLVGIVAESLMKITPNYKIFINLDEKIVVPTVADRKNKFVELADAFLILPGGFGTFEEISQIVASKEQKQHSKPIVFLNLDSYFSNLLALYKDFENKGFTKAKVEDLIFLANNIDEVFKYFDNYHSSSFEDRFV